MTIQDLYLWLDILNRYPVEGNDKIKISVQNKINDLKRGLK